MHLLINPTMKKLFISGLLFLFAFSTNLNAQAIEVIPSYGYQFGTRLNYGPNYVKLEDSGQFGISLGVELQTNLMLELSYFNISSESRIRDVIVAPFETRLADINLDWFLVGATRYFKSGPLKPFAGGGLGLVVVSPSNENRDVVIGSLNSSTRFAFSFKAGINYMFSESIGINLQGNLFFPVNYGGFYIGTGGAGISTGSTLILGGFSGGLVFRFDR